MNGINVIRVPLYPSHDRSSIRRMINYISFGLSTAAIGPFFIHKPDVIHVYNLPTLGLAAYLIRAFSRCKVIYDIQDLWPDSVASSGMVSSGTAIRTLGRLCNWAYKHADHITVLSPGMKDVLAKRGIAPDRITCIYNWCEEDSIRYTTDEIEEIRDKLSFRDHFNVVFAGTMGKMQSLNTVLDTADQLKYKAPKVKFTFIGGGIEVDNLKARAKELDLPNVQFLPRRPVAEIGAVMAAADALLVHLKDDPLFRITIPSKIQAYMYIGKPLIAGVSGDAADLVESARAGVSCKPGDSCSIADAVMRLANTDEEELRRIGENGRRFYAGELSFTAGVRRFDEVFRRIISDAQTESGLSDIT